MGNSTLPLVYNWGKSTLKMVINSFGTRYFMGRPMKGLGRLSFFVLKEGASGGLGLFPMCSH